MAEESTARLMVVMFTDIVGSVDLKSRLGNQAYHRLASRHDDILSAILDEIAGAEILKDLGDGYLLRFATASEAVSAAARFQQALAAEPWAPEPVAVRVGLHIGEVSEFGKDATGALKIVGLAVDLAARVMGLALPGQILMTRTAFDDARQFLQAPAEGQEGPELQFMAHGRYLFKGSEEPLAVFEVGAAGVAPLAPPPDSEKARRAVAVEEEATLGWRPATGLEVVGRKSWTLQHKLGEGGFGEVWLAKHEKTRATRVFKFCFDADRLRSFKRELTLFRLIREVLGDRDDIARLYEIQLDSAPYFLESQFAECGDLTQWAQQQEGGIAGVPLATRLDLVARTADAVAAAHSVAILHKDIKPSNILVYRSTAGEPRPRLSDFGIGVIADRAQLEERDITVAGFTDTALLDNESSRTGTRLYAPPESLIGERFTMQGDIYALGVLLYQLAVGDLRRPLGPGWERDIDDEILREDIARCVDIDPQRRLSDAGELSKRLRELESRRQARRRTVRRRRVVRVGTVLAAAAAVLAVALVVHTGQVTRERDRANDEAETARQVSDFLTGLFEVSDPDKARGESITAREILDRGAQKIQTEMAEQPRVQARLMDVMGMVYTHLGLYDDARPLLSESLETRREQFGEQHVEFATGMQHLADLYRQTGEYDEAIPLLERALEVRRVELGPQHPDTLENYNNIGLVRWLQGDLDAALPIFEEILAIRESILEPNDLLVGDSLNNMALLLWEKGDNEAALPYLERALTITEATHGPEHPDVGIVLNNLANLKFSSGDTDGARPVYARALAVYEKALGAEHPRVALTLSNFAALLVETGDYAEAVVLHERALRIREKALAAEHPSIAQSLNNLADTLRRTGDFDRARPLYERALAINETAFGPQHPEVAWVLAGMAILLGDAGDHDASRLEFERALAMLESELGPDHSDLVYTLKPYAEMLRRAKLDDEAQRIEQRAGAIQAGSASSG